MPTRLESRRIISLSLTSGYNSMLIVRLRIMLGSRNVSWNQHSICRKYDVTSCVLTVSGNCIETRTCVRQPTRSAAAHAAFLVRLTVLVRRRAGERLREEAPVFVRIRLFQATTWLRPASFAR